MKTPIALVPAFILCAVIVTAGCSILEEPAVVTPAPTVVVTTLAATPSATPVVSSREPSAMALQLADLPKGYIVRERADIPYSDASDFAREQGWQKGYQASFYRMDADNYDVTSITQRIGVYYISNINLVDSTMQMVFDEAEDDLLALANDTVTVTELPFPEIGSDSTAYRISEADNTYGITRYVVIFTKSDVFEAIEMKGTTTDFEELKRITAEAARKIP